VIWVQFVTQWACIAVLGGVLVVMAKYFLIQQKRTLSTLDDMAAQIIAFKNPWAAQQFAGAKHAEEMARQQAARGVEVVPDSYDEVSDFA
jgi:uncharacterized membrane protein YcjF (UPF0283 family)